ncbi:PREDICTED: fibrinogen C domain-containing protein 1-like isoform X1 [Amphimedon queenslandica]|uniref:Fibrinogen C-terminal domain-containing protein n=1 Tax=Amphimedon queenslandica TaxID=400682 RepID=A0A1X7T5S2_AMPQE|nr:PREDICTED: fibrinogen C domain-containing protein 1-like isoform X1 [Amphimedon queenslandica]|eukprot:XP_019861249.1 PREDICTED: fibrinogen C domain-containing protein 1-like isoform X1 [Amphimedon queenslandica]
MIATKLMYSLMIIIVIINTANGNCPDDEKETASPVVTITNTSVNATPECVMPTDCKAWKELGGKQNGVYPIKPDKGPAFQVYCDMETDGGGWTVFQRRQDGSVDFYRNWTDYENGFGDLTGELWLGLSKIHRLTKEGSNTLRVDLKNFAGNTVYANYSTFSVGDGSTEYILTVGGYSGTATDSLAYHNGMRFSTRDNDNDQRSENCAEWVAGAWWHNACYYSNLNGRYFHSAITNQEGIVWYKWTNAQISLKFSEMKTRRNN